MIFGSLLRVSNLGSLRHVVVYLDGVNSEGNRQQVEGYFTL